MSRTYRKIPVRFNSWFKEDFNIAKDIEHYGYYNYFRYYTGKVYVNVADYINDNFRCDAGVVSKLEEALKKNDHQLWILLTGRRPIDLSACKKYTEYKKRSWRQSFKKNKQLTDYEDWDYVKYPKLLSISWRHY